MRDGDVCLLACAARGTRGQPAATVAVAATAQPLATVTVAAAEPLAAATVAAAARAPSKLRRDGAQSSCKSRRWLPALA